jgi:Zn-dependent protease with chaperone function
MDFFKEQDIARRNTRLLVILFILAVGALLLLTNLLVTTFFYIGDQQKPAVQLSSWWQHLINSERFLSISGVILFIIAAVVVYNWLRLAQGGRAVAEALGGRPALPATPDPLEKRAVNIVEEIALAANMPVPPLYILDDERGINAFAAGIKPTDAVVAITRGAMVHLTREELQGVIGHEFSHILNGDMRLSMRLAAMLRGITFIGDVGQVLLRLGVQRGGSRHRKNKESGLALLFAGLGLYTVGLLGRFFAGAIKAGISQQKEYLADASAVQFTRNPDGIANALKVIGGYTPGTLVHAARAEELSHFFFGEVTHRLWGLFATHPPLPKRIQRIDPQWGGEFIRRAPNHAQLEGAIYNRAHSAQAADATGSFSEPPASTGIAPLVDDTSELIPQSPIPEPTEHAIGAKLIAAAHEPLDAVAIVLGFLWHPAVADVQASILENAQLPGVVVSVPHYASELTALSSRQKFQLIEIAIGSLKWLSPAQYTHFSRVMKQLVKADNHIDLFEWTLYQLVRHYVDDSFQRVAASKPRYKTLENAKAHIEVVLGTLATLGQEDTETAFHRGAEAMSLTLELPQAQSLSVEAFSRAVTELAQLYPLPKASLLKGLAVVATHDGIVDEKERVLIHCLAAIIDCPTPDAMLEISK